MSQTSYSRDRAVAVAGMRADSGPTDVVSYPAAEDIEPGRAVVLVAGKVQVCSATTFTKMVGVAMYDVGLEQAVGGGSGFHKAGAMVPVMRKGRIWAQYSGGGQSELGTLNVHHSSTIATNRGKFTNTATSAVVGSEITAAPEGVLTSKGPGTSALVPVELNLSA